MVSCQHSRQSPVRLERVTLSSSEVVCARTGTAPVPVERTKRTPDFPLIGQPAQPAQTEYRPHVCVSVRHSRVGRAMSSRPLSTIPPRVHPDHRIVTFDVGTAGYPDGNGREMVTAASFPYEAIAVKKYKSPHKEVSVQARFFPLTITPDADLHSFDRT